MDTTLTTLLLQASLAPSGHNTQPWRFSTAPGVIRIHPDHHRRLPVVDPDDHALYISLGCALENLLIAAAHHGLSAQVDVFPDDEPGECLRIRLSPSAHAGDASLYTAIPRRQSNRRMYDGKPIPADHLTRLLATHIEDSVTLKPFETRRPEVEPIIEFVKEGNRAQFSDPAFVEELVSWIRFNPREVRAHQDGLTTTALGFPPVPRWLGRFIMTHLVTPEGEARRQEKAIRGSALLLLFIAHRDERRDWVALGQSFQRVALTATSLGISHAHVNMPCEVLPVRRRLAQHLELPNGQQPLLLVRLGYAKPLAPAPRRPVETVMQTGPGSDPGN
jgi:nitroreductase